MSINVTLLDTEPKLEVPDVPEVPIVPEVPEVKDVQETDNDILNLSELEEVDLTPPLSETSDLSEENKLLTTIVDISSSTEPQEEKEEDLDLDIPEFNLDEETINLDDLTVTNDDEEEEEEKEDAAAEDNPTPRGPFMYTMSNSMRHIQQVPSLVPSLCAFAIVTLEPNLVNALRPSSQTSTSPSRIASSARTCDKTRSLSASPYFDV